ncbi:MAG: hypothetical protein JNJ87_08665 [Acinetobacter junii]|nr:hypothetical protein [Acinetobacter junii]
MKHSQKGDGILGLIILFIIAAFFVFLGFDAYNLTEASTEQLKEVNAKVELAQKQPFAKEFNKQIKPLVEDNYISKREAKEILMTYETTKLKYNAVSNN